MDEDQYKRTLENAVKVLGDDPDNKFTGVGTIIGRVDTWPCQLMLFSYVAFFLYVYFDVVAKNIGFVLGFILFLPLCFLVYKLPVIHVIEPLSEEEKEEYLEYKYGK